MSDLSLLSHPAEYLLRKVLMRRRTGLGIRRHPRKDLLVAFHSRDEQLIQHTISIGRAVCVVGPAAYALVLPATGELLDAWTVNAYTCLGAVGIFAGAYLLLPELGRNVRRVGCGENAAR